MALQRRRKNKVIEALENSLIQRIALGGNGHERNWRNIIGIIIIGLLGCIFTGKIVNASVITFTTYMALRICAYYFPIFKKQ